MVEKAIWLDIARLCVHIFTRLHVARENMDAQSCNIKPYCLLNHQIICVICTYCKTLPPAVLDCPSLVV